MDRRSKVFAVLITVFASVLITVLITVMFLFPGRENKVEVNMKLFLFRIPFEKRIRSEKTFAHA